MTDLFDAYGNRYRVPDIHEPRRVVRDEILKDEGQPPRFRRVYSDGSSEVFLFTETDSGQKDTFRRNI